MSSLVFAERDPATNLGPETHKLFKVVLRNAFPKAANELTPVEVALLSAILLQLPLGEELNSRDVYWVKRTELLADGWASSLTGKALYNAALLLFCRELDFDYALGSRYEMRRLQEVQTSLDGERVGLMFTLDIASLLTEVKFFMDKDKNLLKTVASIGFVPNNPNANVKN